MSSVSNNLEAEFIFLHLHPEIIGGKVELLGIEQIWALSDPVSMLLSHHRTIPSSQLQLFPNILSKQVVGGKKP